MYRTMTREDISRLITTYNVPHRKLKTVDTERFQEFFEAPNKQQLVSLLLDSSVNSKIKRAILTSLNTSLNYSSVKHIKSKAVLYNLLTDVNLKPVFDLSEAMAILKYITLKSKNTSVYMKKQVKDVRHVLSEKQLEVELSGSGFQDHQWASDEAGADGIVRLPEQDILLYLRYGTSVGGHQNDRYRSMFSTAKKHPEQKFLFIVDGVEALLQSGLCKNMFEKEKYTYKNAYWLTVKALQFFDFDSWSL